MTSAIAPMPDQHDRPVEDLDWPLLDLAAARLQALAADPDSPPPSTLDAVMRQLFNPQVQDQLVVAAFQSAL